MRRNLNEGPAKDRPSFLIEKCRCRYRPRRNFSSTPSLYGLNSEKTSKSPAQKNVLCKPICIGNKTISGHGPVSHLEMINLKRRKLGFQGIEQCPDLRRVGHHAVNQFRKLGILDFIGLNRIPLGRQPGGKLGVAPPIHQKKSPVGITPRGLKKKGREITMQQQSTATPDLNVITNDSYYRTLTFKFKERKARTT